MNDAADLVRRTDERFAADVRWWAELFMMAGVDSEEFEATPGTVLALIASEVAHRRDLHADHPLWHAVWVELRDAEDHR